MNKNKISILFLIQRSKINKQGKCPIRCRITYHDKRHEFATGLFVAPEQWQSKLQKTKQHEEADYVNSQIGLIRIKLNQAFLYLQVTALPFDVTDIYNKHLGKSVQKEYSVLEVYKTYLERIKRLIGKDIELVTYNKYVESFNHMSDFIKSKYKSSDILLKDLKSNFLDNLDYYLKTGKDGRTTSLQQSTINKVIQRFRKVISYAIAEGHLVRDPFILHKSKRIKKPIVFLTNEELLAIQNHEFKTSRVQKVKDLFVFCCYTGFAFKEMAMLRKADIALGADNEYWIKVLRGKTNRVYYVPLFETARKILEKYSADKSDLIFPNISNQKFNEYLKEIADVVGVKKTLTHHVARKTYASTILLNNDVPIEVVSKLLGHAKITTTQEAYAELLQSKVSQSIAHIRSK